MSAPAPDNRNWIDRYLDNLRTLADDAPDDYTTVAGVPIGLNPRKLLDPPGAIGSMLGLGAKAVGDPIATPITAPTGAIMRAMSQLPDIAASRLPDGQRRAAFSDKPEIPFAGNDLDPAAYAEYAKANLEQSLPGQIALGMLTPLSLFGGGFKALGTGLGTVGTSSALPALGASSKYGRAASALIEMDKTYTEGIDLISKGAGNVIKGPVRDFGKKVPLYGAAQEWALSPSPAAIRDQYTLAAAEVTNSLGRAVRARGRGLSSADVRTPGAQVVTNLPKGMGAWSVIGNTYTTINTRILNMAPERQARALRVFGDMVDATNAMQTRSVIERGQLLEEWDQLKPTLSGQDLLDADDTVKARLREIFETQAQAQHKDQLSVLKTFEELDNTPLAKFGAMDPATAATVKQATTTAVKAGKDAAVEARRYAAELRGKPRIDPISGLKLTPEPIWRRPNWHENIPALLGEDIPYREARQRAIDAINTAGTASGLGSDDPMTAFARSIHGMHRQGLEGWDVSPITQAQELGLDPTRLGRFDAMLRDPKQFYDRAAREIPMARNSLMRNLEAGITAHMKAAGKTQADIDAALPRLLRDSNVALSHEAFRTKNRLGIRTLNDAGKKLSQQAGRYDQYGDLLKAEDMDNIIAGRMGEMFHREELGIKPLRRGIVVPGVGMTALDELQKLPGMGRLGAGLDKEWKQEAIGKLHQTFLDQGMTDMQAGAEAARLAADPRQLLAHPAMKQMLFDDLKTGAGLTLGAWKEMNLLAPAYHVANVTSQAALGTLAHAFGAEDVDPKFWLKLLRQKMTELARTGKASNSIPREVSPDYVMIRGNGASGQAWAGLADTVGEQAAILGTETASSTGRIPTPIRLALFGGGMAGAAHQVAETAGLSDEDEAKLVGVAGLLGALYGWKVPAGVKANFLLAGATEKGGRIAAGLTGFESNIGQIERDAITDAVTGTGQKKEFYDAVDTLIANLGGDLQSVGRQVTGPVPLAPGAPRPAPLRPPSPAAPVASAAQPVVGPAPAATAPSAGSTTVASAIAPEVGPPGPTATFATPEQSLERRIEALSTYIDNVAAGAERPDQADVIARATRQRDQLVRQRDALAAAAPAPAPEAVPAPAAQPTAAPAATPVVDRLSGPPSSAFMVNSNLMTAMLVDQEVDTARRLGLVDLILDEDLKALEAALDARKITIDPTNTWDQFDPNRRNFWGSNENRARQQLHELVRKRMEILTWPQQTPITGAPAAAAAAAPAEAIPAAATPADAPITEPIAAAPTPAPRRDLMAMIEATDHPDHIKQMLRYHVGKAEEWGIVDSIEQKFADGLGEQAIANRIYGEAGGARITGLQTKQMLAFVKGVRSVLGIPSKTQSAEMSAWREAYRARQAEPVVTTANAIDPNAPGSFAAMMGDEGDDLLGEAASEARLMAGEFDEPGRYAEPGMFDEDDLLPGLGPVGQSYDEAQRAMDEFDDLMVQKYGEDAVADWQMTAYTPEERAEAQRLMAVRDAIGAGEDTTARAGVLGRIADTGSIYRIPTADLEPVLARLQRQATVMGALGNETNQQQIANDLWNWMREQPLAGYPAGFLNRMTLDEALLEAKRVADGTLDLGSSPVPLLEQLGEIMRALVPEAAPPGPRGLTALPEGRPDLLPEAAPPDAAEMPEPLPEPTPAPSTDLSDLSVPYESQLDRLFDIAVERGRLRNAANPASQDAFNTLQTRADIARSSMVDENRMVPLWFDNPDFEREVAAAVGGLDPAAPNYAAIKQQAIASVMQDFVPYSNKVASGFAHPDNVLATLLRSVPFTDTVTFGDDLLKTADTIGLQLDPHLSATFDRDVQILGYLKQMADDPIDWSQEGRYGLSALPDQRPEMADLLSMTPDQVNQWIPHLSDRDRSRFATLWAGVDETNGRIIADLKQAIIKAQADLGLVRPGATGSGLPPLGGAPAASGPPAAPPAGPPAFSFSTPDPAFQIGDLKTSRQLKTARNLAYGDMPNAPDGIDLEDYFDLTASGPKIKIGQRFDSAAFKRAFADANGRMTADAVYDLARSFGASRPQATRLRADWDDRGFTAERAGKTNADAIHIDYQDINNLIYYGKMGPFPFLTWQAKAIPKYLQMMAHHPAIPLAINEYTKATDNELEEQGLPKSFRNYAKDGGIISLIAQLAMQREGDVYANTLPAFFPYSDVGKEQSDYDTPVDKVLHTMQSVGLGPSPLITAPLNMLGLTSDLPVNMLRNSPLLAGGVQALTGHAVDPEALPKQAMRGIRGAINPGSLEKTITGDPIKDYYVRKRISSMAAEKNQKPTGQYLEAIQNGKGPIWDLALRDVEREMGGRAAISWVAPVRTRLMDTGEQVIRDAIAEQGITNLALEELNRQPLTRHDLQYAAASLGRNPLDMGETLEERAKSLRVSRQYGKARAAAPVTGGLSGLGADPRSEARRAQLLEQETRRTKPLSARARASRERSELSRGEAILREMGR